jgi:hypothetical protein
MPPKEPSLSSLAEQLRGYLDAQGLVAEKSGDSLRAYLGEVTSKFDKLVRALGKNPKVRDPEALAAWIGKKVARSRKRS